ncbi:DUF1652 domain-containing protein [Stutzerimonas urumqiensis]|uniref:hypothetical protein n=1 Tax=Stutzerimonas urumqiensis TaxID=638269 RepID=UPI003DA2AFB8
MLTPRNALSLAEATRIAELAFLPYRAVTTADREDASFSLRVVDEHDRILTSVAHVARSQYQDSQHLAALIEHLRLELSRDGHSLAPWSMPHQPGVSNA